MPNNSVSLSPSVGKWWLAILVVLSLGAISLHRGSAQIQLAPDPVAAERPADSGFKLDLRYRSQLYRMTPEEAAIENLKVSAALQRIHAQAATERERTIARLEQLRLKSGAMSAADVTKALAGKEDRFNGERAAQKLDAIRAGLRPEAAQLEARMLDLTQRALASDPGAIGNRATPEALAMENLRIQRTLARIRGVETIQVPQGFQGSVDPTVGQNSPGTARDTADLSRVRQGEFSLAADLAHAIYMAEIGAERELRASKPTRVALSGDKSPATLRAEMVGDEIQIAQIRLGQAQLYGSAASSADSSSFSAPRLSPSKMDGLRSGGVATAPIGNIVVLAVGEGNAIRPHEVESPLPTGLRRLDGQEAVERPTRSVAAYSAAKVSAQDYSSLPAASIGSAPGNAVGNVSSKAMESRIDSFAARERLKELLERYLADRISFQQYYQQRTRLLAFADY